MSVSVVMQAVHLFGAVIWVGGLTLISWVLLPAARTGEDVGWLQRVLARFQWVSRACSLVLLLSGGHLLFTRYPMDTWFSTRGGMAAFAMMVMWLILTAIVEMSARARKALGGAGAGGVAALGAYYHTAMGVGLLLILDAAFGFR